MAKITCTNECPHCLHVGDGDGWCDVTEKIVIEDWIVTDDFMGPGCPYIRKGEDHGKLAVHRDH